ncbi:MAG: hypothetical protein ACYC2Z_10000, partial [Candidatus Nanopelagicales bacterium]
MTEHQAGETSGPDPVAVPVAVPAPAPPAPAPPAAGESDPEPVLVALDPRWLRKALVMVVLAIVGLQVINWGWNLLGGFLFNLLLAWLIAISVDPIVSYLARRGMRRGLATALVAVGTTLILAAFIALFGSA